MYYANFMSAYTRFYYVFCERQFIAIFKGEESLCKIGSMSYYEFFESFEELKSLKEIR